MTILFDSCEKVWAPAKLCSYAVKGKITHNDVQPTISHPRLSRHLLFVFYLPSPHPHIELYNSISCTENARSANRSAKPASSMISIMRPLYPHFYIIDAIPATLSLILKKPTLIDIHDLLTITSSRLITSVTSADTVRVPTLPNPPNPRCS